MNGINLIQPWLKRNGCNCDTGGYTAMTHTIMSGGKLYVSEDLYDEFLGVYGREIEHGNTSLTYSERRSSDVFRMYVDLDILEKCAMDDAAVLDIVRVVQRTTALFFPGAPGDTFRCVVSRTKTKEVNVKVKVKVVEQNAEETKQQEPDQEPDREPDKAETAKKAPEPVYETFTKNGVHLNFPKLLVNLEIALQIRFSVVNELEKDFGQRGNPHNPWSDVVDKAPYFNGLKMPGSVKTEQCTICNSSKKKRSRRGGEALRTEIILKEIAKIRRKIFNKDDEVEDFDYANVMSIKGEEFKNQALSDLHAEYVMLTKICSLCNNKGWYLEDRWYSPSHVLGAGGVSCTDDLDYIRKDLHEQMRWTSIRARASDQVTPGYNVPAGQLTPTVDTQSECIGAFGSAGLEWVSPGLYREMLSSDVHAEDARGQSRWKGSHISDADTMRMITACVRGLHTKYNHITVKEAMELKTGKHTEETSKKITKGAGAGMTVRAHKNKSTTSLLSGLAGANNATVKKDVIMRVYTTFTVRVSGEGSKYCQNKCDEHTSNSVYFSISKKGICQMCHSGKDTPGSSGKVCKKYFSDSKTIPVGLRKKLFPDEFGLDMAAVHASIKKRGAAAAAPAPKKKVKKKNRAGIEMWGSMC